MMRIGFIPFQDNITVMYEEKPVKELFKSDIYIWITV
jgi:hypothetical protein